ncbi:MAG TPA: hypothetical protein VLT84_09030 [Acidobacteriota bacterium]|nr:hypothetical protein [Acidobacteriota bacterium]
MIGRDTALGALCLVALLPAYSHNDYRGRAPLTDALRLGYRGVEADVVLANGRLLVGHDRSELRAGRDLESLYMGPLADRLDARGRLLEGGEPFRLFVEFKIPRRGGIDSLRALLARYPRLVRPAASGEGAPLSVIVVGGTAPAESPGDAEAPPLVRYEADVRDSGAARALLLRNLLGMVSLDARRLSRWRDGAPPPEGWRDAVRRLAALKREGRGVIARVHHAAPRAEIYAFLVESGVDLIGSESLERSARILGGVGGTGSPRIPEPPMDGPRVIR